MADLVTATASPAAAPAEVALSFEEMMRGVPPAVRAYLLSPELVAAREKTYAAAKLSSAERENALDIESDIFFGLIPLADFPDALWSELPWPDSREAEAKKLAIAVAGTVLLPARAYLGDVAGVIAALGGNAGAFSQTEIPSRQAAYEDAVNEVVRAIDPTNILDLDRRERLEQLLEERFRGGLDRAAFADRLIRAYKLGGYEADPERAALISALAEAQVLLTEFSENPPEPQSLEEAIASVDEPTEEAEKPAASRAAAYSQAQIRERYAGSADEQQRLKAVVDKCASLPDGAEKAAAVAFAPANVRRDPWDIVGSLLFLAQSGQLPAAAKSSPGYAEAMRNFFAAQGRAQEAAAFAASQVAPEFLAIYLRIALQRYAGFGSSDSSRFGLRISNLLKKTGVAMPDVAAFDPATGDFRWMVE